MTIRSNFIESEDECKEPVLITRNRDMQDLCSKITRIAQTNCPVFICGESGTGKEIIANLLHQRSKRSGKPFCAVNCGAIPRDIVDSELFGHEKGAFTGAVKQKKGYFEMANNGTLFLDEVTEMNEDIQVKLLRAVEYSNFRRVGGEEEINTNIRLIAATNRKIDKILEEEGSFRKDLFYRISVIQLEIPPLRARKDDIEPLADYFISEVCKKYEMETKEMDHGFLQKLIAYNWPGNIRELRNIIERCVIMCPDKIMTVELLPSEISNISANSDHLFNDETDIIKIQIGLSVEEAEKKLIEETLSYVDNNKSKAAKILGFSRKTLHNKLNKYA